MISFNNPCLECKSTYNKLYFGICCKSLALAFGTTFALNMVRALLMFPLKEDLTTSHSIKVDSFSWDSRSGTRPAKPGEGR